MLAVAVYFNHQPLKRNSQVQFFFHWRVCLFLLFFLSHVVVLNRKMACLLLLRFTSCRQQCLSISNDKHNFNVPRLIIFPSSCLNQPFLSFCSHFFSLGNTFFPMCSRSDKLSLKQSILNNASEWETERAFRLFQWENLSHVTQDAHSRTKETVLFPLFLRQLLFSIRLLAVHVLIYSNISIPLLTCVCVCVFLVGIVSQFAKQTTTKGIQL